MPVSVTENAMTVGARFRLSFSRTPAATSPARSSSVTLPLVRELERVRQQVLEDLLQPLGVGEHRRAAGSGPSWIDEVDALRLGHVAERALDVAAQLVEAQLADVDDHRARLDLRQVEDVVDQRRAGRCPTSGSSWRTRPASPVRLPSGFLRQLIGQDQQAVERRAQLVRHVGQELGLVLRRERELLGLLFQRLAGLLDLLVLALDFLRSGGRAAAPFPPAPRWSAATPPAGSAAPEPATATA